MSLTVSNNISILTRSLNQATQKSEDSMKRLATGQRINSAKDDAAGLAIATRMQSRLQGMAVAQRNAQDGLSLAQVADSAIGQAADLMSRMKELATQSANGSNTDEDRALLHREFGELALEVGRTLTGANFNGSAILAGDAGAKTFIVGPDAADTISVTTTNLSTNADVTAVTAANISTAGGATTAMTAITTAVDTLMDQRALFGATMSRFDSAASGLESMSGALESARSRIMDTDYALETANMQKQNVLQQAAMAMVSQANQKPSAVLNLLR